MKNHFFSRHEGSLYRALDKIHIIAVTVCRISVRSFERY